MSTPVSTTLPVSAIRSDFPILGETMRGKPLVYLDNGATSLKPQEVIDAEIYYLTKLSANIHRGVYEFSERATELFDEARVKVKAFIGAGENGEVIFTRGATEGLNIVAASWGSKNLGPGDQIVVTEVEHHANLIPWQEISKRTGAELRFVPLRSQGEFSESDVAEVLTERTKIVAVTGMSNVTGYIPPIKKIIALAHANGSLVLVDGAQLVSHHPVDVVDLDCDFLAFSAHKMCGPTGVGALYGKVELLNAMDPVLFGGDMIVRVKKDTAEYKDAPDRFESGTPNISGVIGFGAAVDYLSRIGMAEIAAHEQMLGAYAAEQLALVDGVELYGRAVREVADGIGPCGGVISFNIDSVHPHDVGAILDSEGVAVRAGFHCAQPFMQHLGVTGTIRASFYLYNTTSEVDQLVLALAKVREIFS